MYLSKVYISYVVELKFSSKQQIPMALENSSFLLRLQLNEGEKSSTLNRPKTLITPSILRLDNSENLNKQVAI
jgi:hypothetical protein